MTSAKPKVNPTEIVAILRDVTVTYDGYQTRALSHAGVEFRRGEVTGVLGAKGAGKTTALKILAGQLAPTEGTVRVFGRSPRRGAKARIGYLPGKVDLNRPSGFVDRLFGRKRIASPAGRGVARLAQAMLGNRDLLVLDDPFAGLEPVELAEAKALIREMVSRGKTVILSSDALMDVKDLCERLVILHEGKVQASGALAELLSGANAIRFLPAILPGDVVERVLRVLREEILVSSSETISSVAPGDGGEAGAVGRTQERLTPLTRPAAATPGPSEGNPDGAVDHQKLEGLVKPPTPK